MKKVSHLMHQLSSEWCHENVLRRASFNLPAGALTVLLSCLTFVAITANASTYDAFTADIPVMANYTPSDPIQWATNGHYYQAMRVPGGITWDAANAAAQAAGGYLATITSAGENAFVYSLISDPSFWYWTSVPPRIYGVWIGGTWIGGTSPGGEWTWVTGEPWDYTSWAPDQPDDMYHETAVQFFNWTDSPSPTWNDLNPDGEGLPVPGYIIEFSGVPEPCSFTLVSSIFAGVGLLRFRRFKRKVNTSRDIRVRLQQIRESGAH